MSQDVQPASSSVNERLSAVVSSGIVAVMMTCAAIVVLHLGQRLVPTWNGAYLAGAFFLVALESVISTRLGHKLELSVWPWAAYRATELILLLAALKLFLYTHSGLAQLLADLPRWQQDLNTFFEGEYLFAGVLLILCWVESWMFAQTLLEMESPAIPLEREALMEGGRQAARRRLASHVFILGAVLVMAAGILRSNLNLVGITSPALQVSLVTVLLYFVLGLILLSQGHLAVLRAVWSLEQVEISRNMALRWTMYSIAMLLVVGLAVSLLPTRYSLGLLGVLSYLINAIMFAAFYCIMFFTTLLAVLWAWLTSLLGIREQTPPVPSVAPTAIPPQAMPPAVAPVPWLDALKSLFFWAVFLGVLGYSLYYYASQRKEVMALLRRLPFWRWLARGWRALWSSVKGLNQSLVSAVQAGLRRLRATGGDAPWQYLNVRRLSPRERVRFFYLALLRRAGESGLPRRPDETPYEYESDLAVALPEADPEVAALTDAYIEARYSQHAISAHLAGTVRKQWERLRRALRQRQPKA